MTEVKIKIPVTTNIDFTLKRMLEEFNIPFNDALEFGGKFLLAERDASFDYPPSKLYSKISLLIEKLEEMSQKYYACLDKQKEICPTKDPEKEADEFFKEIGATDGKD